MILGTSARTSAEKARRNQVGGYVKPDFSPSQRVTAALVVNRREADTRDHSILKAALSRLRFGERIVACPPPPIQHHPREITPFCPRLFACHLILPFLLWLLFVSSLSP